MIILVDDREKQPYTFESPLISAFYPRLKHNVRLVEAHLSFGDYSLPGSEFAVAFERKSLADLFCTLGQNRDRFEREIGRLAGLKRSAVFVESTVEDVLHRPPSHSSMHPHAVLGTCLSWSTTYRVPFVFCGDRAHAELACFVALSQAARSRSTKRV